MLVSSVGYLMGNMEICARPELGKARACNIVNRGLAVESKKSTSSFDKVIDSIANLFRSSDEKLAKQSLDMIA